MLFRRKIYDTLLDWKRHSADRKALLIEGARRVGKSTIAEEFARNEYESYILIDFAKSSDAVRNALTRYVPVVERLTKTKQVRVQASDLWKLWCAVRDARESAGMTQAELAGHLGWSQATVSKVEAGTRPLRVEELIACAEALGMDAVQLFSSAVVEATAGLD